MAWETRKGTNNTYYTQSKRVDGRVIRQYLGNSYPARELARQCEEMRELRNAERLRQAKKMDRFAAAEAATERYCQFVDMVLQAVMEENGYHYHRGEWRKRRVPKKVPAADEQRESVGERQQVDIEKPHRTEAIRREPKRRPMPVRPMLDLRSGKPKGVGCYFRMPRKLVVPTPLIAKKAPDPVRPRRRTGPRRHTNVGQGLDPRPPPR